MEQHLTAALNPGRRANASIHVLVVEDECLIGEWVAQALTAQGFGVQMVTNAADALRHLAAEPVHVLFTDINLGPGMDGVDLARRARAMRPALTVVYASARAALMRRDACVPGGIIVPKPYDPDLVGRLLMTALCATAQPMPV